MYIKKSNSPNCNLSDEQYIFCVSEEYEKKEQERINKRRENVKNKLMMLEPDLFGYENPVCPHCGSKRIVLNGTNDKKTLDKNNEEIYVRLQRYGCKSCSKTFQAHLDESNEENNHFPSYIKDYANKLDSLCRIPLRKMSDIIKLFTNINISYETIRKYIKKDTDLSYFNEDAKLSGYYGFDAQWIPVDSKYIPKSERQYEKLRKNRCYVFRLGLFDLVNDQIVAEKIVNKETPEVIKEFIDEILDYKDRTAIVTDLKNDYVTLMRKLKFKHQKCTFHLRLNINKDIKTYLSNLESKFKALYLNKNKKEIEKMFNKNKKEISEWMKAFWKIFKQDTFEQAMKILEDIRSRLNEAPEIVQKILSKKFFPEYRSYLLYLEEPHLNKLNQTNNKIENYFGATLPKADKNKYRTLEGVFSHIINKIENSNY